MESTTITSEITEVKEEQYLGYLSKSPRLASSEACKDETSRKKHVHPIEDEHTQLIETHGPRKPSKGSYSSHSKTMDLLHKSALKKPVRVDTYQVPGLGISESVTLKQALRKLCISQASEMAAMKRLSKPIGVSVTSEAGTIKRLYAAVVVQSSESGNKEHEKLLEISLLPKKNTTKSTKMVTKSTLHTGESCNGGSKFSLQDPHSIAAEVVKPKIRDVLSSSREGGRKLQVRVAPTRKEKTKSEPSSVPTSKSSIISIKSDVNPRLVKPISKNKDCSNKKVNHETTSAFGSCNGSNCQEKVGPAAPASNGKKPGSKKGSPSSASSTTNLNVVTCLEKEEALEKKPGSTLTNSLGGEMVTKRREISRSREKGECSQSSKSSCGDYSSSTSISDESNQSGSSVGIRPHMSNDVRWAVIRHVEMQDGSIGLKNFKLLKRLGCGDIGTVYLAELIGLKCSFALKVMDNEFLISRKKITRARTEREILEMLDHPFLPTLYTHFTTDNLSCLVMEYCPGGDLHVLRQKQLGRCFSEPAARFYVAEVLLALEYLHMLGVVYRDLKPENILVREDGHIMLSDFDLSLRCTVSPRLSTMGRVETVGRVSGVCGGSHCIDPLCLQPSCAQVSCFTPRLTSSTMSKTRKLKSDLSTHVKPLPQLVVEPVEARSNSFVGTHEYLAPEIIKGEGHGSSVDWWTFGIFLYELLFGRTPFKGSNNDETLANVVSQSLKFPDNSAVGFHARDLIKGLLVKEPENRLGSLRGAAEIKGHPFFTGLNWALIRCAIPPEVPLPYDFSIPAADPPPTKKKEGKGLELRSDGDDVVFELF